MALVVYNFCENYLHLTGWVCLASKKKISDEVWLETKSVDDRCHIVALKILTYSLSIGLLPLVACCCREGVRLRGDFMQLRGYSSFDQKEEFGNQSDVLNVELSISQPVNHYVQREIGYSPFTRIFNQQAAIFDIRRTWFKKFDVGVRNCYGLLLEDDCLDEAALDGESLEELFELTEIWNDYCIPILAIILPKYSFPDQKYPDQFYILVDCIKDLFAVEYLKHHLPEGLEEVEQINERIDWVLEKLEEEGVIRFLENRRKAAVNFTFLAYAKAFLIHFKKSSDQLIASCRVNINRFGQKQSDSVVEFFKQKIRKKESRLGKEPMVLRFYYAHEIQDGRIAFSRFKNFTIDELKKWNQSFPRSTIDEFYQTLMREPQKPVVQEQKECLEELTSEDDASES